jgi:4-amino-4-deoxy-L-arabinose transferase-like glycosyltransferase
MAVQSWTVASPYIVATGQEVLPMGGFTGSVPEPTLSRITDLVSTGQLRFVLLSVGVSQSAQIASWVKRSCTTVPAKDYGGGSGTTGTGVGSGGPGGFGGNSGGTLYLCGNV